MAATVQIHEMTGASAGTDKTSGTVRFKLADDQTVDTNNRMQIPTAGSVYSFTKQLRLNFTVQPVTDIQNLRAYTDGGSFATASVAVTYTVTAGFTANATASLGGTGLFTKTSASPIDLDANNAGPHTGTGYKGDFLRMQLGVASTAGPGVLTAETLTFAYDET